MKTVLIVEDEKLIRQGLRTMIARSGVPIEEILECPNGEEALEVLKTREIDVMFTDIRMPKMSGIELVQEMQSLPRRPHTIAVSGYDDFSYAVEMLRGGVMDYLLKPIDRRRLNELLLAMNEQVEKERDDRLQQQKISIRQLHMYLIHGKSGSGDVSEELILPDGEQLRKRIENGFRFVAGPIGSSSGREIGLQLIGRVNDHELYIADDGLLSLLQDRSHSSGLGVSALHSGAGELQRACEEAETARAAAFFRGEHSVLYTEEDEKIPEALLQDARKQLSREMTESRVQLLGAGKSEQLRKSFHGLFFAAGQGRLTFDEFSEGMKQFLSEIQKTYPHLFQTEIEDHRQRLSEISAYVSLDEYEASLTHFLNLLLTELAQNSEQNASGQKMKQAVDYIRAHFDQDLNMAVVSNLVSMNYSQFSLLFKQYTGENFVNYLRGLRMEEAKKLLKETDRKI